MAFTVKKIFNNFLFSKNRINFKDKSFRSFKVCSHIRKEPMFLRPVPGK